MSRPVPMRDSPSHAGLTPGSPRGVSGTGRSPRPAGRTGQRGEAGSGGSGAACSAADAQERAAGARRRCGDRQPSGHPLHHHPARHHPAHHHPAHRHLAHQHYAHHHPAHHPPCPLKRCKITRLRFFLGEGITSSVQTPITKYFQMSPPNSLRTERGDPHLTVRWQRSPAAGHIPPWEMLMCCLQITPRILKKKAGQRVGVRERSGKDGWKLVKAEKKAAMVKS